MYKKTLSLTITALLLINLVYPYNDTICQVEIFSRNQYIPDSNKYGCTDAQVLDTSKNYNFRVMCGKNIPCNVSGTVYWSVKGGSYKILGNSSSIDKSYTRIESSSKGYDTAMITATGTLKNGSTMFCQMYVATKARIEFIYPPNASTLCINSVPGNITYKYNIGAIDQNLNDPHVYLGGGYTIGCGPNDPLCFHADYATLPVSNGNSQRSISYQSYDFLNLITFLNLGLFQEIESAYCDPYEDMALVGRISSYWTTVLCTNNPPQINMITPADGVTIITQQLPTFISLIWKATDDETTQLSCSLSLKKPSESDYKVVWSGTTSSGASKTYVLTANETGTYKWSVMCSDGTSTSAETSTFKLFKVVKLPMAGIASVALEAGVSS